MGFCKYGEQQKIGNGIYYVCSVTKYPCKFARWCSSSLTYKPNANFSSCNVKVNKDKEYLNKPTQKQIDVFEATKVVTDIEIPVQEEEPLLIEEEAPQLLSMLMVEPMVLEPEIEEKLEVQVEKEILEQPVQKSRKNKRASSKK